MLGDGRVVGIFPEGPFSREGRLVPGRPGAAAIALRAAVPVVPAAIRGTYEALAGRPLHLPRRHPLSVRFGPPLGHPSSDNPPVWGQDAKLTQLVIDSQHEWDEDKRIAVYANIQRRIDELAILVPLYVPRRYAAVRADLPAPQLDDDLYRIDAASVAPATVVRQP